MSGEQRIVVVGGGPAAKAAAGAYREAGGLGPLTILAGEDALPYERPPLTKEFLRGEIGRGELPLQRGEWYRRREIDLVQGAVIDELDLDGGEAIGEDGRRWPFDRCLLATGARPLVPDLPGVDLPGVRTIRTIADSERLAALGAARVLVVGSGFIGCEAAVSLAMRGADVTVATLEPSPQVERLGERVSERFSGWLGGYGVTVVGGAELAEISADSDALTAGFKGGREQRADAVLLALGITRNDGLAATAGVETDEGVLVDTAMVSSDPRLLAAGDVAVALSSSAGRRLKVEHWGEALSHGELAGRTLAGKQASWGDAPGFWSTLGEHTVKYAGWGDGWDELAFEAGDGGSFTAWYGRDGEIVGVLAHERDQDHELGKRLIEERAPWS
jgi:3-phenylpropionate/trans-cinnamate dioxygenase ferredoxin reductase component